MTSFSPPAATSNFSVPLVSYQISGKSCLIHVFTFSTETFPAKVINNLVNKSNRTVFIPYLSWTFSSTLHCPCNLIPENFPLYRKLSSWLFIYFLQTSSQPLISSFVQLLGFLMDLSRPLSHFLLSCKVISPLLLTSINICMLIIGVIILNFDNIILT